MFASIFILTTSITKILSTIIFFLLFVNQPTAVSLGICYPPLDTTMHEYEQKAFPGPQISRRTAIKIITLGPVLALYGCSGRNISPSTPDTRVVNGCVDLTSQEEKQALSEFTQSYGDWKNRYIRSTSGNEQELRVIRPESGDDIVSEGIGYGMIFAAISQDKVTFDKLWTFARNRFDTNGLMNWKMKPDGTIDQTGSASDADLDMAYALVTADKQWRGYDNDANQLLTNILAHEVKDNILQPGDNWGDANKTINPSYFSPAYYELFRQYTKNNAWQDLATESRKRLDAIHAQRPSSAGLFPNWINTDGSSTSVGDNPDDYTYDAARIPLRQAMAVLWYCDNPAIAQPAISLLKPMNAFFARVGAKNIKDGYKLDGTPTGKYHNATFVATAAAAAIVSDNPDYQKEIVNEAIQLKNVNYYNDSLRLFTLAVLSGKSKPN